MRIPARCFVRLQLSGITPTVVIVTGSVACPDGVVRSFRVRGVCATNGTRSSSWASVPEGELIGCTMEDLSVGLVAGQIHMTLQFWTSDSVNGVFIGTALDGWVGGGQICSYPAAPFVPLDIAGGQDGIEQVADPAAGADWSWTSTGILLGRITAVRAKLSCSATVATRNPVLWVNNAVGEGVPSFQVSASTAGTALVYTWCNRGAANFTTGSFQHVAASFPSVGVTRSLSVVTSNLQVGDQWSEILIFGRNVPVI